MLDIKISPSILSADFSKLGNEFQDLEKAEADFIHIDVMDGHFVPNITIGPEVISKLRKYTSLPFDVHLMISSVDNFIKSFANVKGMKVIGINYKDNPKKAVEWLRGLGNPYSDVPVDKDGRIAIDWGVYGIPETFVINSNGIIKYRHIGPITKKIYKKINLLIKDIE